jgi:hypothetical protein
MLWILNFVQLYMLVDRIKVLIFGIEKSIFILLSIFEVDINFKMQSACPILQVQL